METLELCYKTPRGAGVVRYLRDMASTEKALKNLMHRHIEADLYVASARDDNGNRAEPVGGVGQAPGVTWNGRHVEWNWWIEADLFVVTPVAV
jgi:hypothetical protein